MSARWWAILGLTEEEADLFASSILGRVTRVQSATTGRWALIHLTEKQSEDLHPWPKSLVVEVEDGGGLYICDACEDGRGNGYGPCDECGCGHREHPYPEVWLREQLALARAELAAERASK